MAEFPCTTAGDPLIYTSAITADLGITDRCLRSWVSQGKFAQPDANISGKNAWLASTYTREKTAILGGRFKRTYRSFNRSARDARSDNLELPLAEQAEDVRRVKESGTQR